MNQVVVKIIVFLLVIAVLYFFQRSNKHYSYGDVIPLWVDKIGSFDNLKQTYDYNILPFCDNIEERKAERTGRISYGDRAVLSQYLIPFKEQFEYHQLCDVTLTKESTEQFLIAIKHNYYFTMIYDELLIGDIIGKIEDAIDGSAKYFLYTHLNFLIGYNGDQVIYVELNSTMPRELLALSSQQTISNFSFTYSAKWIPTQTKFEDREFINKQYPIEGHGGRKANLIAFINNFVVIIFFVGTALDILMRIIRKTYPRWDENYEEESRGWRAIPNDVFRFPSNVSILSVFIGIGTQFIYFIFGLFLVSLFCTFFPINFYLACFILYAITSEISGFESIKRYRQFNGKNLKFHFVLVVVGSFLILFSFLFPFINMLVSRFKITTAIPFMTTSQFIRNWILVGLPMTIIGWLIGLRFAESYFYAPGRVNMIPRTILTTPWYTKIPCQMAMAGIFPFLVVYFHIFCFPGLHAHNKLFLILFMVFIMLLIVTPCSCICLTYLQLSFENYKWWWPAFFNGGSTGIFIYVYSIYHYIYNEAELDQPVTYFSYLLIVCFFIFILLGTVGFLSSLAFNRKLYPRPYVI